MIDLYYWPTPNGHKITMMLEETGLDYRLHTVNITRQEQFAPEFLAISPNNRIPAIVDTDPADGGPPVPIFESGAILSYLARKTGRFGSSNLRNQVEIEEWLFWQVGGLGPMAGQNHHFGRFAPEKIPYAINRYVTETARLYGVLDTRLRNREFVTGDTLSIADFASYPWITPEKQGQDMSRFSNLARWCDTMRRRPATQRAYAFAEIARNGSAPFTTTQDRAAIFHEAGL